MSLEALAGRRVDPVDVSHAGAGDEAGSETKLGINQAMNAQSKEISL